MSRPRILVLIVDDSAVVRHTLSEILSSDPEIEVIGTAADPFVAAERMREQAPDVITLDIEMPRMDGLTFLQKIMTQHPIPVVICSSLAEEGAQSTLKALEYGAVEIITKPHLGSKQFLEDSRIALCQAVKAAAAAQLRPLRPSHTVEPKLTADAILSPATHAMAETTEKVVVIGASTGGTEALKALLEVLPPDAPGIVIVQHMPELFTRAFANRLDGLCNISVKEAETNDTVIRGRALIAPGNHHMLLKRSGARYYVDIKEGPLVCRHRP
jgi:two-component system, chemotaxis family, protein-glutamate methylesterase/glutaminase